MGIAPFLGVFFSDHNLHHLSTFWHALLVRDFWSMLLFREVVMNQTSVNFRLGPLRCSQILIRSTIKSNIRFFPDYQSCKRSIFASGFACSEALENNPSNNCNESSIFE